MTRLSKSFLCVLFSFGIVALGQPAIIGWLGAFSAFFGFALFFAALSPALSKSKKFWAGSVWFATVQLIQLSWMTSIEFQGYYILFVYVLLALAIGCQFGFLTVQLFKKEKLSFACILYCACLWTLMEWSRLFFLSGFTWNPIGLSLTHFLYPLQFASVVGIFGLSFWAMLTNLMVFNFWKTRGISLAVQAIVIASIPYVFGVFQLTGVKFSGKKMDVVLVQTQFLPSQKFPTFGRLVEYVSPFVQWDQILTSLKEKAGSAIDLIVFPEAAVSLQADAALYPIDAVKEIFINQFGPGIEKDFPLFTPPFVAEIHKKLCVSNLFWCQTLSNHFNAELLVGLDCEDKKSGNYFNSAFFFTPRSENIERYDKQVLLPLAEYLPWSFLKIFTKSYGIVNFFTPGDKRKVFGIKNRLSPSICYEETFPSVMRKGRKEGACLFVNLTNDNYFPNSSLHKQHLYHARVRAVENGVPLVRSCNSGISAAIDSFGRIHAKLEEEAGVLTCSLDAHTYPTLYTLFGDGLIIGFSWITCLCIGFVRPQSRKIPAILS